MIRNADNMEFSRKKQGKKSAVIFTSVCLLLLGIGIGMLIPGKDAKEELPAQEPEAVTVCLPEEKPVGILQILPLADGSVAVLYTDGTVAVSGNAALSEEVASWNKVERLLCVEQNGWGNSDEPPVLVGLTGADKVLSTAVDFPRWRNIKEIHSYWEGGLVGVTHDGSVLTSGELGESGAFLKGLSNVESLANMGEEWGCLKKDGSVVFNYELPEGQEPWENVKQLRSSDHGFYAILEDNTVAGDFGETFSGAVKVVDYEDWLVGISADGRLLTHNGGSIYHNTGDMVIDVPGIGYLGKELKVSDYTQLKDVVAANGIVLINKDGTVASAGGYPGWEVSTWNNIEKVIGSYWGFDSSFLYGIQKDGSVIVNRYDWDSDTQTTTDQYRDWRVQEIYRGNYGVVALTTDGKLVGDGIYENIDFPVFGR